MSCVGGAHGHGYVHGASEEQYFEKEPLDVADYILG